MQKKFKKLKNQIFNINVVGLRYKNYLSSMKMGVLTPSP